MDLRGSGQPGLSSQDVIDCVKRPIERSPGMCQLPREPGALRDCALRAGAAPGHSVQEGSSRGLQLFQGHLQGPHADHDSGQQ